MLTRCIIKKKKKLKENLIISTRAWPTRTNPRRRTWNTFDGWCKERKDIKMFYPAARVEACETLQETRGWRGSEEIKEH